MLFMASNIIMFSQPPSSNYKLVYSDEFNTNITGREWNIEPKQISGGITDECKNSGHGYFTDPSNCTIENGKLIITGRRAFNFNLATDKFYNYTAGGISTGWYPQFGYFEIRCKMPSKVGFYPAFWFFNTLSSDWSEIDIFEYCAGDSHYNPSVHFDEDLDRNRETNHFTSSTCVNTGDISADYHTYGVEWTPTMTFFYFDGVLKFETATRNNQDPMIMLISLGVDVCFGGCEPDFWDVSSEGTEESQKFKVDYCRYYQEQNQALRFINTTTTACVNTTQNRISVSGYPNVTYKMDILPPLQQIEENAYFEYGSYSKRITSPVSGTFPITVTATFPSGYIETKTTNITFIAPSSCTIGGVFNNSSSLSYVNFTNRSYNTVSLSGCPNADRYEVERINIYGGQEIYAHCNTACNNFSFDMNMNGGQSVTFRIKAFDYCGNLLGSRDAIFVKNQSGGYYGRLKIEKDDLTLDNKIAEYEKDKIDVETETFLKNNSELKNDKNNFSVFPNPSQYSINVMYPKKQVESIRITDILGKNCKTIKLGLDEIGFQNIDVSDIQNGVYIVTFYSDSKEVLHRDKIYISR
jgi:beta-glucanase (GH16 family)